MPIPTPTPTPTAVTWTTLFSTYLAPGTAGNCGQCHFEMGDANGAYQSLAGRGVINGANTTLASQGRSPLTWFGGNMPPGGPGFVPQAAGDFAAWVTGGAQNN
jgi:hypothetical protein